MKAFTIGGRAQKTRRPCQERRVFSALLPLVQQRLADVKAAGLGNLEKIGVDIAADLPQDVVALCGFLGVSSPSSSSSYPPKLLQSSPFTEVWFQPTALIFSSA